MHWGDPLDAGIDGRVIYQTAEVGLLTRHILINGVREAGNFSLEGELANCFLGSCRVILNTFGPVLLSPLSGLV